jgi:heat shock protein HtpX
MDSSTRRRSLRSASLTIRMIVLAIGVPLFVIAAVAAVLVFAARGHAFGFGMIVFMLIVGTVVAVASAGKDGSRGRELTAADTPELMAMVARLCALIDIPEPEVRLSPSRQANSWVIHRPGHRPRLYVTGVLLELLTGDELQAVLAHELTHIANRDALVMTVVATPGMVAMRANGGMWGLPIVAIGVVATLGSAMLSRCRELTADAGSAAITGRPSALASALMKVADSQTAIPDRDLRAAAAHNAFNLVAVPPRRGHWRLAVGAARGPFASHPRFEARLHQLQRLEREQQQRGRH